MSVRVSIVIYKDVPDIDKANDFADEVKNLLDGNVDAAFECGIQNSNPTIQLTKEQESE